MRHISLFNIFNESISLDENLKMNIASTTDGYLTLKKDDPTIPMESERSIDKKIITDPKEFFNYQFSDKRDNETRSSLDDEGILRIRIGGKDFLGRPAGVTHILLRVPSNFNYDKFSKEVQQIRHQFTRSAEVESAINKVKNLLAECMSGGNTQNSVEQTKNIDTEENYTSDILQFVNPIINKVGKDRMKEILLDIVSKL